MYKQIKNIEIKDIAMACKLMPYYRLGIFQKLTSLNATYRFSFFGDIKEQGGIGQIPFDYANIKGDENIRWIRTKNYFYKPERLLWQTGIVKEIFKSKYKAFVFEGAIAHLPIWLFALLCKVRGKKVLYWTHGDRGLDKGIKKMLRIALFKWLGDGLMLYGHTQKKIMVADGYNPNKVFVIYNSLQPQKQFQILAGLDSNDLHNSKSRLFKTPSNFTFIFIGRLVAQKGLMEILKAIVQLKSKGYMVNIICIGEGPEKEKMNRFVVENNLDEQVYFTGAIYKEEELAPYFAMADLMVSPGNVGLNCIHALAYGVPVITHDNFRFQNPEVEAIEEGVTGSFYEYDNFESLVLKIQDWIEKKPDIETIKSNCQNIIKQKYNPQTQSECMVNALQKTFNIE